MNLDELPLHKIIWDRLLKHLDEPPPPDPEETRVIQAIKRNFFTLVQAVLIATAITKVVQPDVINLTETWKWLATILPGYSTHQVWYIAFLLCAAAALTPWIGSILPRLLRHCIKTHWASVFALLGVVFLWNSSSPAPEWKTPMPLGWSLITLAFALRFWKKPISNDDIVDRLQRNYFVDRLMECFQRVNSPIRRIAILGGWGTGKTVLLRLLRRRLEGTEHPRYGVAMVNPWVAQDVEEVHSMVAQAFEEALGPRAQFRVSLRFFRWLSSLTGIKVAGTTELSFDLKQLFRGGPSVQEDLLVQEINETLRSSNRICVILVDDMERAEPEVIRRVFPLIDLLRRIEHCFFVFGIDPARVARAFRERGQGGENTKGYFDKVFDLQINLPHARPVDLARMCKKMLDENQTPKLHAAWESISPFLPATPREAIHFVRDATMREVLFLNRYGVEEHDYVNFFKLLILGIEVPGITNNFDVQTVKALRDTLHELEIDIFQNNPDIETKSQDAIDNAWRKVKANLVIPTSKEDRLKSLFSQVLSSTLDVPWACHHHMRLLTLSYEQRIDLHATWDKQSGRRSIINMISETFPDIEFSDPEVIASTLIEAEMSDYGSLREKLLYANSAIKADATLKQANRRLQALVRHLESPDMSNTERELYPKDYFESWMKILFNGNLGKAIIDSKELQNLEKAHSIAASSLLTLGESHHFARFRTESIIFRYSHHQTANHLTPHIDELRRTMQLTVYKALLEHIRIGDVAHQTFLALLGIQHLSQIFGDVESWNPRSDDLNALRQLDAEIADNPNIAVSMAAVARSLLESVGSIIRNGGRGEEFILQTIRDSTDYTCLVWQMALRDSDQVDDLMFLREYYGRTLSDSTNITTVQFNNAFPTQKDDAASEKAV